MGEGKRLRSAASCAVPSATELCSVAGLEFFRAYLAENCRISAASLLETAIVTESRGGLEAGNELDLFLESADIEVAPVTSRQVSTARRAWRRFGKGRHRDGLNFGDCFAYALSATTGEPLLFKGNDFTQTDVNAALPSP